MAYTTIDDSEAYFQVVTYTGDGAANHAITLDGDTDMQPDLVWIKNRDATDSHCVFDAARGATKLLLTDSIAVESTDTDTLDSFTTDGFQVDADVKVNTNAEDYVAFCWKANGSGSANTDGAINTTKTSANTTSGFCVNMFSGTGADSTVGHGLAVAPQVVLCKNVTEDNWNYNDFKVLGGTGRIYLNENAGNSATGDAWNSTIPSSTVISLGPNGENNGSSEVVVQYVWHPVQGFSAMGGYQGNGAADGTFVYTGFKVAFILVKQTNGTANWIITDNKRDPYNVASKEVYPNNSNVEGTDSDYYVDFLSNGFKYRGPGAATNGSNPYLYMAFAEAPLVNSNGVPCTAR